MKMKMDEDTHTAQHILHHYVKTFFENNKQFYVTTVAICSKQDPLSLRVLDWLCTNYSKGNRLTINTDASNVHLYHKYKNHLKGFGKKFFDPFCRNQTMQMHIHDLPPFTTTLGQLNFFKWAFENSVIGFAITMKRQIEKNMHLRLNISKAAQKTRKNGGRMQLSTLASNHCQKRIVAIRVEFP